MPPVSRTRSRVANFVLLAVIAATVLLGWVTPVARPGYAVPVWLINMVLLVAFSVAAGVAVTGLFRGVLIDSRNKISLSRFQTLLWTVLLLSAFLTAALVNIALGQPESLSISLHADLWGLLGISAASLVGSPLIKTNKKSEPTNQEARTKTEAQMGRQGSPPPGVSAEGQLVVNEGPELAGFTDMFKGEEVGNAAFLDLGKVQMFFFTLVTWFAYARALGDMFTKATGPRPAPITGFPDLDTGMIALLGISHAAYLANKAIPHTPQPPGP